MTDRTLPTPLRKLLSEAQPEDRLQRIWAGVGSRRIDNRERRRMRLVLAASVAAILGLLVLWGLTSHSKLADLPHAVAPVPARIVTENISRQWDIGDGATVFVEPFGQLDVLDQSSRAMLLALRRGKARFDIRPGGVRTWRIECGGISVEVIGTEFLVERGQSDLRVTVHRGKVLVRGNGVPDGVQVLEAGKELLVRLGDPSTSIAPLASTALEAPAPELASSGSNLRGARRAAQIAASD